MFEDILGATKKLKPDWKKVCKECGSSDIAFSDKMLGPTFIVDGKLHMRYRQFVRCYSCNSTYYIRTLEQYV